MSTDAVITQKIDSWCQDFVPEADRAYFEKYLLAKLKHSPKTFSTVKTYLKHFYDFVEKPIVELDFDDIDDYIQYLDESEMKRSSKCAYMTSIHKYVKTVTYELNRRGARIVDLFPPEIEFAFDEAREDIEGDEDLIPAGIMDAILAAARARSQREYVFFLLLKYCGMRVSECRSIKVKNVHLDERYLVTGVVRGCMKSNKDGQNPCIFFFPRNVAVQIRQYLTILKPGEEWLFPSVKKCATGFMVDEKSIIDRYSGMTGFHIKSHSFRKTLITRRIKDGCLPHVSKMLVNHAIDDVEFKHYIKLTIAEKRDLYDASNPYK